MDEEKIYTVEFESYEGGGLIGVYKTLEEARDKLRRLHEESNGWYDFKAIDDLAEAVEGEFLPYGDHYRIYERKFGDVDK